MVDGELLKLPFMYRDGLFKLGVHCRGIRAKVSVSLRGQFAQRCCYHESPTPFELRYGARCSSGCLPFSQQGVSDMSPVFRSEIVQSQE